MTPSTSYCPILPNLHIIHTPPHRPNYIRHSPLDPLPILLSLYTTVLSFPSPHTINHTTTRMASHLHQTTILKRIAVDYTPDACHHSPDLDEIHVTFDHRGGARWRSPHRFLHGTFSARIKCPFGNTSGLNFNIYLSSLEGDKSQDEIDFEFLGKDKTIVQTNYYCGGVGGREVIHDLGFDCSEEYHEYAIKWGGHFIEWLVDGAVVRREERREGDGFPEKPMFLYASVWDASYIDEGRWTGEYAGEHAPYVCWYKDVRVPTETLVMDAEEREVGREGD